MTNHLKSYVRRTILQAARDYAGGKRRTADSTHAALTDAMRGTDSGWWNDLIYIAPMLDMAHRYRRDIAMAFEEYRDATGGRYTFRDCSTGTETGADEILSALLRGPFDFEDYRGMNGDDADATLLGLRFAVEWYAGEVARDLCPDM